jgi:hypothetical protein
MKCPSCDQDFKSYTAVSLHFRNKHGTSLEFKEIMRLKLIEERHGGVIPTCKCGCGGTPKYYDYDRGYVEYVRGHAARVHNNWGHNSDALLKSQDVRREQIAAGEWKPWNLGGTKDTDERIKTNNTAISKSILSNDAERKIRSERLSKGRLDGTVRTLFGKESSQWKGGVSSVQALSRSYVFNVWTYPKLHAAGFTCQGCGSKERLEVHHEARDALGDVTNDFSSHQSYARWVADYHVINNVSGVVLCEACHNQAHQRS